MPRRHSSHVVHPHHLPARSYRQAWLALLAALLGFGAGYYTCYERDGEVMAQVYRQRQLVQALAEAIQAPLPSPSPLPTDHTL